jgi:hypothetical protein
MWRYFINSGQEVAEGKSVAGDSLPHKACPKELGLAQSATLWQAESNWLCADPPLGRQEIIP